MLDKMLNVLFVLIMIAFNSILLYLGYKYSILNVAIILALLGTIISLVIWVVQFMNNKLANYIPRYLEDCEKCK